MTSSSFSFSLLFFIFTSIILSCLVRHFKLMIKKEKKLVCFCIFLLVHNNLLLSHIANCKSHIKYVNGWSLLTVGACTLWSLRKLGEPSLTTMQRPNFLTQHRFWLLQEIADTYLSCWKRHQYVKNGPEYNENMEVMMKICPRLPCRQGNQTLHLQYVSHDVYLLS